MAIPEEGDLLRQFEDTRRKGEGMLLFQGDRDFKAQDRWVRESVQKEGAPIHLLPVSTERDPQGPLQSAGVDPLDGDILNPEFLAYPPGKDQRKFNIRVIVEHQPSKQELTKYGIDEQREVGFHFVRSILDDLSLVEANSRRHRGIDIGDLVFWDGTWYILQNVHRDHYFGQTVNPYFVVGFASRYQLDNVPIGDVSDGGCPDDLEMEF